MAFSDRAEAGRKLAARLLKYKGDGPVVLALPRGGVAVAAAVAAALAVPLDLLLVRKLGAPIQPELAMGAIVDAPEPITVRNEDVIALCEVSDADFEMVRERELAELGRRRALYLGDRPRPDLAGRTVIVVDDGIATGATMLAALRALRAQGPRKIVLATPVAPRDTLAALKSEADDIVCLLQPALFFVIGAHYADFRQLTDEDVMSALARSRGERETVLPATQTAASGRRRP